MIKVAVLGYGVVGKGVVDILDKRDDVKVVLVFAREQVSDHRFTTDIDDVIHCQDYDVMVEAMGGLEPAYRLLMHAVTMGKHIVTSNKELVSTYGAVLHQKASEKGVHFLFEASVGGGIPIISTLRHGLAHEKIYKVEAILNGTSNYILSSLCATDRSFATVLQEAQQLGYAEKDPSDDIDGIDTARKLAILGSILTKQTIKSRDIETVGIRNVHTKFFDFAKKMDYKVRLIAHLMIDDTGVRASVEPVLLPKKHPLYAIDGVDNAVCFYGEDINMVMLSGPGAGREPTASAVVADVYACMTSFRNTTWSDKSIEVLREQPLYAVWAPIESEMTPFSHSDVSVLIMTYEEAIASGCQFVRIEGEL